MSQRSNEAEELFTLRTAIWSNFPYSDFEPKAPPIKRGLDFYEILLRFDRHLFEGARVLDFGCGFTSLKEELSKTEVHPKKIYMVDINPDVKKKNHDATILDGKDLRQHFGSRKIDYLLALASTYQIPPSDRENIYRQMLEITRGALHIAPIYHPDFDFFSNLTARMNFDIVACRPYTSEPRLITKSPKDYDAIMANYPEDMRVIPPAGEEPIWRVRFFIRNLDINTGSSYLILRRQGFGSNTRC